jgi:hypothetical protein
MITLPHIMPIDPNKPLPPSHKPNVYQHFHLKHDIENCKRLKHLMQKLIDLGQFSIGGVSD